MYRLSIRFLIQSIWLVLLCNFPVYPQQQPTDASPVNINSAPKPIVKPDAVPEVNGNGMPLIRSKTELVTMNITVTDQKGRCFTNLNKEHFEIYDDNVLQKIEFFSTEDSPISIGILLDISKSMEGKLLTHAVKALNTFLSFGHEHDQVFIIGFNRQAVLITDFTTITNKLVINAANLTPQGSTALYDAVYLAVEKLRYGKHKRQVLLIISDGNDNDSYYKFREAKEVLKEANTTIYAIGGSKRGTSTLKTLTDLTGGSFFYFDDLDEAVSRIALEMRQQYSVGFAPSDAKSNSWHELKVKIKYPKELLKLKVRSRKGYYS